ncbi:MAG: hypothetical protein U0Z75_01100 [Deinococcaceae bacterium]
MDQLLEFLRGIRTEQIAFRLDHIREAIMVSFATPGVRWEVKFFADGTVETETFLSSGVRSGIDWTDIVDIDSAFKTDR